MSDGMLFSRSTCISASVLRTMTFMPQTQHSRTRRTDFTFPISISGAADPKGRAGIYVVYKGVFAVVCGRVCGRLRKCPPSVFAVGKPGFIRKYLYVFAEIEGAFAERLRKPIWFISPHSIRVAGNETEPVFIPTFAAVAPQESAFNAAHAEQAIHCRRKLIPRATTRFRHG